MHSNPSPDANRLFWRRSLAALVLFVIVGGAIAAVWKYSKRLPHTTAVESTVKATPQPVAVNDQPPSLAGYVGSAACAPCHTEIAESFKTHPMSRSISRVDPIAEAAKLDPHGGHVIGKQRVLKVEIDGGIMRHHEKMFDDDGELIYDQAVPIEYVVGSGRRATAYLHRRDSLLFMSPLNWYAQPGQWDLAPGYAKDDPRRFDRRVVDECLGCHAGRVAAEGRGLNRYQDPAFFEMSIGCENCHGPGEGHSALHTGEPPAGHAADPIVNPARLDPERRESVCNQCHLQSAARIVRSGRSDLDFRPGQRFEEIWTAFDQGSGVSRDGRTRSVSHVQQMRESRCYRESAGRFGCISCHDPHRVPPADARVTFYRQKCFGCHLESSCSLSGELRQEKGDSCIACHMPERDSSNMSHVTQTDHRVIRTAGPAADAVSGSDGDTLVFFDRADLRLDAWERDRALGLAAWKHLSRIGRARPRQLIEMLAPVLDTVPRDGAVLTAIGSISADNRLVDQARGYFELARDIPAAEEAALSGLLDIYYAASDRQKALRCADHLLEIDPGDARVHALRADLLAQSGEHEAGIKAAVRALELNPTLLPVRVWLVAAYRDANREREQRAQEQIILRMQDARPPP